ncbi:MAG: hypothetical protein L3J14_07350 [Flavobacteriaceae bacterium]|nr:hypothetical protein [Flavobacteriaceae bacterium]
MTVSATNKSALSQKIAGILALFIGVMSVFAGSKVLLEIDTKSYAVLFWLVSYNVIFGAISMITAYFIWKNKAIAKTLTLFVLTMHFLVFIYLKFMSVTTAQESVKAMIFRTSIWILIAVLSIVIPNYLNTKKTMK